MASTWYVAPDRVGEVGTGQLNDPWSLEWSGSIENNLIKPGDRVLRRGSKPGAPIAAYKPFSVADVNKRPHLPPHTRGPGFVLARSGEPGRPIVYADFKDETSIIADPIVAPPTSFEQGWTQAIDEPGRQVWQSKFTVGEIGSTGFVGGYFSRDGVPLLLSAYRFDDTAQLHATTSLYRDDGAYYIGPGVVRMATGHIRVRLDPHIAGEDVFLQDTPGPIWPHATNPNDVEMHLFLEYDVGLILNGDWIVWDGGEIHGFNYNIRDFGNNNNVGTIDGTFTHGKRTKLIAPGNGLRIGTSAPTRHGYYRFHSDGLLRYATSHFSFLDIKGGIEPCVHNRNQGFTPVGEASRWQIADSLIENHFDGSVVGRPDGEFGWLPEKQPDQSSRKREKRAWEKSVVFRDIWDDSLQIFASAQRLKVHHCVFEGAGVSRSGSSNQAAHGTGWPQVHHNIFDNSKRKMMLGRRGRDAQHGDGTGRRTEEGRTHANAVPSHSTPFPWYFYHNTLVLGEDIGIGSYTVPVSMYGPAADTQGEGRCLVLNNIFFDPGTINKKGEITRVRYRDVTPILTAQGKNVFDGNAYVHPKGPLVLFQRVHASTGDRFEDGTAIKSIAGMRHPSLLLDVQTFASYAPGWEASGVEYQASLPSQLSSNEYRPLDAQLFCTPAEIANGQCQQKVVLLTGFLPQNGVLHGMEDYHPWRGAKAP
jgi:hypothetical protein